MKMRNKSILLSTITQKHPVSSFKTNSQNILISPTKGNAKVNINMLMKMYL